MFNYTIQRINTKLRISAEEIAAIKQVVQVLLKQSEAYQRLLQKL